MKKQKILFNILYVSLVVFGGRLVFIIPNGKYLGILNANKFFSISCAIALLSTLFIFLLIKSSVMKKMKIYMVVTILIFIFVGIYYYVNLPIYTYEEAAHKIMAVENKTGKQTSVYIPEHREDKIAYGIGSFFNTTNNQYFIYIKHDNELVVYRFDPLKGEYEIYQGNRR